MKHHNKYIDDIYTFESALGIISKCGIKIIEKEKKKIIILTELYDINPGSSITENCSSLANELINKENLNPETTVFIHQNPDRGSKYEFYKEAFDIIHFKNKDGKLSNPKWERLSRKQIDKLISK